MATVPLVPSTEKVLLAESPSVADVAPVKVKRVDVFDTAKASGSISAGGGQFQALCGLGQNVEPQLLSWAVAAAVRILRPAFCITVDRYPSAAGRGWVLK